MTSAVALSAVALVAACERGLAGGTGRLEQAAVPRVVINEVMANPRTVADERGEWIELHNLHSRPVDLRGWTVASGHDRSATIERRVVVRPGGYVVLARDDDPRRNGGVEGAYGYGGGIALGNGSDWVAVRLPDGRTADSVAWTSALPGASRGVRDAGAPHADVAGANWATSTSRFGAGDLGTPGAENDGARAPSVAADPERSPAVRAPGASTAPDTGAPVLDSVAARDSTLVVRVLDVGQGEAIFIENGGSRVLVDGGPDAARLGQFLDRFGLDGATIDVVVITHAHHDHYAGLRELFETRRGIRVRYLFESKDPNPNTSLAVLRDSILARLERGEIIYRDSDDPCGNGSASCTITMRGGARLHVLRPPPRGDGPNNRSTALKLVAPDSSAFTMWLSGDAERSQLAWLDAVDYDRAPGMGATVLKLNHHGSCDGITARFLALVRPRLAVISLAAVNEYGYVHAQTLDLLTVRGIPWYRTDQNGTITLTVASGSRSTAAPNVTVERGAAGMRGPRDRVSTQEDCR